MSYSIRTDLGEWKVETREWCWKTGEDRSAAAGAEIFNINSPLRLTERSANLEELLADCSMESMEKAVAAALK